MQSATKICHSCGTRSIAPNIRTIHRNSAWLRRKSTYDVQNKTQLYVCFQQISSSKIISFFPRNPAQESGSQHMSNVQTIILDHAKILQMLMWNQWKTMLIPWIFLLLNGWGWSYLILTYVTLMQTHSNSRQTPPANPVRCKLHGSITQGQFTNIVVQNGSKRNWEVD